MKFLFDHDVPDDMAFSLLALGHEVSKLRQVRPATSTDEEVLSAAAEQKMVLVTCNRDDFLDLAKPVHHAGIIVLVRRRSRAQERAALVRLLDKAGEVGIAGNINFA